MTTKEILKKKIEDYMAKENVTIREVATIIGISEITCVRLLKDDEMHTITFETLDTLMEFFFLGIKGVL